MNNLPYRADLGDYDKARQYMQLQNKVLTYKHQLNSIPGATTFTQSQERTQRPTNVLANHLPSVPIPPREPSASVQAPNIDPTIKETAAQALSTMATLTPTPPSLPSSILTPPPTVQLSPGPLKSGNVLTSG